MRKISYLLAILLTASMFALAPPAAAHTSTYCGHGSAGWVDRVVYGGAWDQGWFSHLHGYRHYKLTWRGWVYTHSDSRFCPPHIDSV